MAPRKGVKNPEMARPGNKAALGCKNNGAPKKEYKNEYADQAFNLCLLGKTSEQIAEALGISHDTLYKWKKLYSDFAEAIQEGKVYSNAKVARSLYEKCFDREVEVEKAFVYKGSEVIVKLKEKREADIGAMKMWLANRERALWGSSDKEDEVKLQITVAGATWTPND